MIDLPAPSDLFDVSGKVAVVTGGSRGIGLMAAAGLVDAGVKVYISSRKAEVCDEVAAALNERGPGSAVSVPADLSTSEGVAELASTVADAEDALHILVNNAGASWGEPLESYPRSAFDKLWAINVQGVFELTRALHPQLRAAATDDDPARVINVGSINGIEPPTIETYAYSSTKAAVHMLTQHLSWRLAGERITVNAIAPGPFPSKMMAFVLDDPDGRAAVASSIPLGRVGVPADIAGAVIYLSSRAGAYLSGAIIPIDGGATGGGGMAMPGVD